MNYKAREEWPAKLQKAVREYPRITASPDFNQRVLQALKEKQARQSKINAFCDVLDRIFERPFLKLLGAALFAILIAWGGSNILLQCSRMTMPNARVLAIPFQAQAPSLAGLYAEQLEPGSQFPPFNNALSRPNKSTFTR